MKDHSCALILGGYVNGYSIMQELYDNGVTDIVLFSTTREPGSYSNKIKKFVLIDKSPGTLRKELQALSADYSSIVLFPTDDLQFGEYPCDRLIRYQTFVISPLTETIFLHLLINIPSIPGVILSVSRVQKQ